MRPMLLETVSRLPASTRGCFKVQEIPVLDGVLKLSIQCQETYLELELLGFRLSGFDYYNYLTKLHLVLISNPCYF